MADTFNRTPSLSKFPNHKRKLARFRKETDVEQAYREWPGRSFLRLIMLQKDPKLRDGARWVSVEA